MMPRGFGILLILLLATLPSFLCAALNDNTKMTKGSEATYRTVSYLVERELSGDMSSTSTSAKELYSSSSVSSTQSGPEDTTLDDPQTEIYYWKKKALEYKKEKLQYKKEKLQYKKDKLQYRYQKESMEQTKENHKLKAREAMSKQSTDGYAELLRDFANTSESNAGDMSSTSTSAKELYSSSSVSSTQSGPEDTTLDDPQKDIYYWKKKALEYKKEKLQYKKETLQYRYQKESMEQTKENHKLKAREAMSKQSTDGYAELLRDFANTSESNAGDMSSTS
eukprot:59523_1